MLVTDGKGTPLGLHVDSASPGETTLLETVLEDVRVPRTRPPRLIADRGYDSDRLRDALARRRIQLIAPHRKSRTRPATQDGRALRRYRRRWIIERTFAWLQRFRRLVVRYEYYALMYLAFLHLACLTIALRRLCN
jgi:transposase